MADGPQIVVFESSEALLESLREQADTALRGTSLYGHPILWYGGRHNDYSPSQNPAGGNTYLIAKFANLAAVSDVKQKAAPEWQLRSMAQELTWETARAVGLEFVAMIAEWRDRNPT